MARRSVLAPEPGQLSALARRHVDAVAAPLFDGLDLADHAVALGEVLEDLAVELVDPRAQRLEVELGGARAAVERGFPSAHAFP
jgi:hypothetical protein